MRVCVCVCKHNLAPRKRQPTHQPTLFSVSFFLSLSLSFFLSFFLSFYVPTNSAPQYLSEWGYEANISNY